MSAWSRWSLLVDTAAASGMVVVAILVLIAIVWLTWRRPDTRRRGLRVAAVTIAVVSLLAIGLRPRYTTDVAVDVEAVLVTPGATDDLLESLADSVGPGIPVFTTIDPTSWSRLFDRIERISDVEYLARHHPEIGRLLVAGYGLPAYEWEAIPDVIPVLFSPPSEKGFSTIRWPREVVTGRRESVSGRVAGAMPGVVFLEGPEGVQDSAAIRDSEPFTLHLEPKVEGMYLYQVRFESSTGDTLLEEPLGVSVVSPSPVAVLILEASPGFRDALFKRVACAARGAGRRALCH